MAITASMVKELREMTGAGMMDCKKALNETDGDMDAAVEFLRKSGAVKAEKKAARIAAEGICKVVVDGNKAAVVEVNSETDFVAKNEKFQTYVESIAKQAMSTSAADIDAFMAEAYVEDASKTVNDSLTEMIAVIGEKLSIRRFKVVEAKKGFVVSYTHGGGRIGVIVESECDNASDDAKEACTNLAMQIAAMNPTYISRDDISEAEVAKRKEITVDSALNDPATLPKPILNKLIEKAMADKKWSDEDVATYEEQKNNKFLFNFLTNEAKQALAELAMADKENISADKIFAGLVDGRLSKEMKEICLMDQVYVKAEDGKQTVAKYLEEVSKKIGATLKIASFVRFETGEGIEKKKEDFAAEVAAQMNA